MSRIINCKQPDEIEKLSFAIIDQEVSDKPLNKALWSIARRLIHTTGDVSLYPDIYLTEQAMDYGIKAIQQGAPIFTDTEMVKSGIPVRRLANYNNAVSCILSNQAVVDRAKKESITRARAGILELGDKIEGSILVIGNAPTALLALLECIDNSGLLPALIIGMPVGFVNAAESKDLLMEKQAQRCFSIKGRRGGSPLAAAAMNALLILADESTQTS